MELAIGRVQPPGPARHISPPDILFPTMIARDALRRSPGSAFAEVSIPPVHKAVNDEVCFFTHRSPPRK